MPVCDCLSANEYRAVSPRKIRDAHINRRAHICTARISEAYLANPRPPQLFAKFDLKIYYLYVPHTNERRASSGAPSLALFFGITKRSNCDPYIKHSPYMAHIYTTRGVTESRSASRMGIIADGLAA